VKTVLELQTELRAALKEPFGPVSTDTGTVLASAGRPLVTVGDIVTYHVLEADRTPDVALVDERTERATVDDEVSATVRDARFDRVRAVANPPGTITDELLTAVRTALADEGRVLVRVDGEEDLAALPVIAAAPDGASVLYGQPGEGVVHVPVGDAVRKRACSVLDRMDGDFDRVDELLETECE
jgi:uncharacterized protein (UPF0218 family)